MNPSGYPSDGESTNYDPGYDGCRPRPTRQSPSGTASSPRTRCSSRCGTPRARPRTTWQQREGAGRVRHGGFYDAVAVAGGSPERHLSLDQGMVMGALGNVLGRDVLHESFGTRQVEKVLRPLIGQEEFSAGIVGE